MVVFGSIPECKMKDGLIVVVRHVQEVVELEAINYTQKTLLQLFGVVVREVYVTQMQEAVDYNKDTLKIEKLETFERQLAALTRN